MDSQLQNLKLIFSFLEDGLVLLNDNGVIVTNNPAACSILGFENESIRSRRLLELLEKESRDQNLINFLRDALQKETIKKHNIISYYNNKHIMRELMVSIKLMPIEDGVKDGRNYFLLVIRDVTQMMEYHRRLLAEKLEGMERVARAVAHSIRNPVTSIGGIANHLLNKHAADASDIQYLRRIIAESRRLEQVVSGVREYTDLAEIQARPVDLRTLIASTIMNFNLPAERHNVEIKCSAFLKATAGSLTVIADPTLLDKLFKILLNNALDAMPEGGLITVNVNATSDGFIVTISDTGKGIAPDDMPYLFDPLFTTKTDAVGMNMAIALRIVREHHGTINVDSLPDEGTTFKIDLPANGPNSMWPRFARH